MPAAGGAEVRVMNPPSVDAPREPWPAHAALRAEPIRSCAAGA